MKKQIFKIILISFLVFSFSRPVFASDSVNINLKIYAGDTALFNGSETVTACAESPAVDAPITINGKCAIEQALLSNTWTWNYAPSGWLDEIGGYATTSDFSKFWSWFNNLNLGGTGLNQHLLSVDEELLLTYNSFPLRISSSKTSGIIGDTIIFTAEEKSVFDENYNMLWTPSLGAIITLGTQSCATIANGTCSIVLDTAGSLKAFGNKTLYVPSGSVNIEVSTPQPTGGSASCCSVSGGSGGALAAILSSPAESVSSAPTKTIFDLQKAFDFLIAQQKENGSFGEDIHTDWTALALASGNYQEQIIKLIKYFEESRLENPTLTDYERHSMALMSLGLNPYNTNGENYIEKIIASFDGKQFGDINEDNDDIFALIVLQNAGYLQDEKIISADISFILNRQKTNGSWDESVDMTGAAIEALSAFKQNEQVKNALVKAKNFLKQNQKENGGWNNASGTAWVTEGILALSEKSENWINNGNTPLDYLATIQETDGGIKNENIQNKLWETAYVASALSGKTWNQIMRKFEKPKETLAPQKVEEKLPKQAMKKNNIKNITLTEKNSNKKDETLKLENLANQNTATALMAIENYATQKTEVQKKNWFLRFLDKIFSIF